MNLGYFEAKLKLFCFTFCLMYLIQNKIQLFSFRYLAMTTNYRMKKNKIKTSAPMINHAK